jgi:hypothetical protein
VAQQGRNIWDGLAGLGDSIWSLITNPDVGTLASIGGFVLSGYVLWTVREIRHRLVFFARVPQIIVQLEANASSFSELLADPAGSKQQLQLEIERCKANLETLRSKIKGDLRGKLEALLGKIESPMTTDDDLWAIYVSLTGVIQALRNYSEDYRLD